jgi:flavin reductase (NADH)
MASLSAAVSVITTDGPRGRAGITVSAVCSVTDSPPTLLVCVNKSSYLHDLLEENKDVCVNVLGADHEELALDFAGASGASMEQRFRRGAWDFDSEAAPVLEDAIASVLGRIVTIDARGSHSVMFVEVHRVLVRESVTALVYFNRQFHAVGACADRS